MKIKMMSRWNASCGVSTHAELVGRAWVEKGHNLTVLAPIEEDSLCQTDKDESYVIRCYTLGEGWRKGKEPFFDPAPFLEDTFDIFLVQNLEMMPMENLLRIYPFIKRKTKTVLVIHEGGPPKNPCFYKFDWDAIVCFDERYKNFLKNIYSEEKIKIIPYPCHPIKRGDKFFARKKLNLPLNKKIIFTYGLGVFRHIHLLPTIERLNKKYPIHFLILTHVDDWYEIFSALKRRYRFIELRKGPISINDLYTYLHASDVLLLHKDSAGCVVVSSTAYLCMGSGCPLLVSDTNFFETLNQEVIKYKGLSELVARLEDIFEKRKNVSETIQAAKKYVERYCSQKVGEEFIELFYSLLKAETPKVTPLTNIIDFSKIPHLGQEVNIESIVNMQNSA